MATNALQKLNWRHFIAVPHRMFFFGGAWALVLSVLWWAAVLLPLPGAAPAPHWLHGWLMVFGAFPFFVFGFLITVIPRWLGTPPLPAPLFRGAACALMLGYVLTLTGALWAEPLTALGMGLTFITWLICAFVLARLLVSDSHWRRLIPDRSRPRQVHPPWAIAVLTAGGLGATAAAYAAITGDTALLYNAPRFGLWAFLAPIVFVVSHRMLPFFAQAAIGADYEMVRPAWAPPVVVALLWLHVALLLTGNRAWLLATDIPLLLITVGHLWCWRPWKAHHTPLLWTLFVAFAWLPIALALSTVQGVAGVLFDTAILGLAPVHALGAGLAASMVFAMATRVSMGHSGRPLHMERHAIVCFLILQAAAVARIGAELPPALANRGFWLMLSALLWLAAFTPWALRLSLIYWQPRIDGRPG